MREWLSSFRFVCFYTALLPLIFFSLDASICNHLKKMDHSIQCTRVKNIDFIYMINLDERPEKYKQSENELAKYGIKAARFSAVNGWRLGIKALQDCGLKYQPTMHPMYATTFVNQNGIKQVVELMSVVGRCYYRQGISRGAIGCALSHISILRDALDRGFNTIWVMEDDIECLGDPRELSYLIKKLDELVGVDGWDVLFTDRDYRKDVGEYIIARGACPRPDMDNSIDFRFSNKFVQDYKVSDLFRRIGARFGTHSMILRRSGMKKLYRFAKQRGIFQGYDLENYLPTGIRRYALTFDLVTNKLNALSDLQSPEYSDD